MPNLFDQTRNIGENGITIAIAINPSERAGLLVESRQRLRLGVEFLQSLLQDRRIIIVPPNEWSIAIRTNRAFRESRAASRWW